MDEHRKRILLIAASIPPPLKLWQYQAQSDCSSDSGRRLLVWGKVKASSRRGSMPELDALKDLLKIRRRLLEKKPDPGKQETLKGWMKEAELKIEMHNSGKPQRN